MKQPVLALAIAAFGALPFAALAADHAHGAAAGHEGHEIHWSYDGDGAPTKWGKLKADYKTCAIGKAQSPIDIPSAKAAKGDGAIAFDYKAAPLKVIDNGHTIQVNIDAGSSITVGGKSYELKQFHFHRPSEEKIDGKSFEMVAHLVHKSADGKLAVVAVLFKQGAENAVLNNIWANLPNEVNKENVVAGASVDVAALLPASRTYFNFPGSLTTPPCSEEVNWFVLGTPVEASRVQLARFGALYPMNARPTQPLNGRKIIAAGK